MLLSPTASHWLIFTDTLSALSAHPLWNIFPTIFFIFSAKTGHQPLVFKDKIKSPSYATAGKKKSLKSFSSSTLTNKPKLLALLAISPAN